IIASFIIVSLILWNTYTFFQIFKEDERNKMELWAVAQKTLQNSTDESEIELTFRIISNNTTIPLIQTNANDSIIGTSNLDKNISEDQKAIQTYLQKLKRENDPVVIEYDEGKFQYLYYG